MIIYKVYDEDYWQDIFGEKQLINLITGHIEDIEDGEINMYIEPTQHQKDLIEKVNNGEDITITEAIELLPIWNYEVDEIDVY